MQSCKYSLTYRHFGKEFISNIIRKTQKPSNWGSCLGFCLCIFSVLLSCDSPALTQRAIYLSAVLGGMPKF